MYGKIKELAAAAVMLQNKGTMDEALRRIVHIAHEAENVATKIAAEQRSTTAKGAK